MYYCYYYRVLYSSPLLLDFVSVSSVSQIRVSAILLVLAEGNYDIRFEEENLVVLCIKIEIQFRYIKQLQIFQDSPQRLSSSNTGDEKKCVKEA